MPWVLGLFERQTWPRRELLVIDDSPEPSPTLARLHRADVRYVHLDRRLPVGTKRNIANELARGDVVCQWDDDDYYAEGYLEFVVQELVGADFVKLDRWYVLTLGERPSFGWWDTRVARPGAPRGWVERNRLGYGFCFSFTREVASAVRSPDTSVLDDYEFARRVVAGGWRVALLPDHRGLALHVIHGANLSESFPNKGIGLEFLPVLFPGFDLDAYLDAISELPARGSPEPGGS